MVNRPRGNQFHFDPATYLGTIRAEVPAYDELQDAVAEATAGIQAERVLELDVGTGETSRRVLDLMDAVCPPPRCSPRSMLTAAGPRVGLRRRDRGCQGHRGLHPLRS